MVVLCRREACPASGTLKTKPKPSKMRPSDDETKQPWYQTAWNWLPRIEIARILRDYHIDLTDKLAGDVAAGIVVAGEYKHASSHACKICLFGRAVRERGGSEALVSADQLRASHQVLPRPSCSATVPHPRPP